VDVPGETIVGGKQYGSGTDVPNYDAGSERREDRKRPEFSAEVQKA
jgi:hypothetical protein